MLNWHNKLHAKYDRVPGVPRFLYFLAAVITILWTPALLRIEFGIDSEIPQFISITICAVAGISRFVYLFTSFRNNKFCGCSRKKVDEEED